MLYQLEDFLCEQSFLIVFTQHSSSTKLPSHIIRPIPIPHHQAHPYPTPSGPSLSHTIRPIPIPHHQAHPYPTPSGPSLSHTIRPIPIPHHQAHLYPTPSGPSLSHINQALVPVSSHHLESLTRFLSPLFPHSSSPTRRSPSQPPLQTQFPCHLLMILISHLLSLPHSIPALSILSSHPTPQNVFLRAYTKLFLYYIYK